MAEDLKLEREIHNYLQQERRQGPSKYDDTPAQPTQFINRLDNPTNRTSVVRLSQNQEHKSEGGSKRTTSGNQIIEQYENQVRERERQREQWKINL
jgi:hypothetical protein